MATLRNATLSSTLAAPVSSAFEQYLARSGLRSRVLSSASVTAAMVCSLMPARSMVRLLDGSGTALHASERNDMDAHNGFRCCKRRSWVNHRTWRRSGAQDPNQPFRANISAARRLRAVAARGWESGHGRIAQNSWGGPDPAQVDRQLHLRVNLRVAAINQSLAVGTDGFAGTAFRAGDRGKYPATAGRAAMRRSSRGTGGRSIMPWVLYNACSLSGWDSQSPALTGVGNSGRRPR